jgi:hypothetical protein
MCLSRDVSVTSATCWVAMRIEVGVGDLVQRIGYSMAERLRGRVTLCAVCFMNKEMRNAGFLV